MGVWDILRYRSVHEMKKLVCSTVMVLMMSGAVFGAKADLDLTKFSSVMVYSGLFNVMSNPAAYVGKSIKLRGQFDMYHDEETGKDYYGVAVMDAGACCATGIDFVLKGTYKFPEDYPKIGEMVTVQGKFEMYRDGEEVFCHVVEADIVK